MRFSVLWLSAILFITPCLAGEAENVRVVSAMVEAINDRDLDRLDTLIAADVARHSAATEGVVVTNLNEFKDFLRADFAGVPDSVITIDLIFGNSEFVALRATYSGTQTGQVGPFPPSNKRVELPYLGILRLADGKVSEMWVEWDNVFMLTQLGHFPPAADEQSE
jgi:predicted ester cyclase